MNTENIEKVGKVSKLKLDELSEYQKINIAELAAESRLIDVVLELKKRGIETSPAALSRYLRRERERALLEDGDDLKKAVSELAERAKDGALREGSLEAVRQRLYERVLVSNDPEEALNLYNAMLKEEAHVRELELEARKVKVAEEQVRLQAIKLASGGGKSVRAVVEASAVVEGDELAGRMPAVPVPVPVSEREQKLVELVGDLAGIVNGGGLSEEKVLAVRERLGREGKLLSEEGAIERMVIR